MPAPTVIKRFLRRLARPKAGPAGVRGIRPPAAEDGLLRMIEGIRDSPLDPRLSYELGVELLRKGIDNDGLRYLDRSFRLDPLNIVRFVQAPELKEIRLRDSIVALLTRVRRDEEQRTVGGYA